MSEELPDWLPQLVRKRVCELLVEHENKPQERAWILKLATDPRMKRVWSYLLKKKRVNYKPSILYLHPVIDRDPYCAVAREGFALRAEWMQHAGMKALFEKFTWYVLPSSVDFETLRSVLPIEQAVANSQSALKWLDQMGALPPKLTKLRLAARRYLVGALEKLETIKFEDKAAPAQIRAGMLASLARNFTDVFGTPMYGQVAIVANVILEEPVKPDQVREAVEGPWGMRGRKVHRKPREQT